MPGWKSDFGRHLDALIVGAVPDVRKAVRWNSPFYGVDGRGWFLSFHVFTRYVNVTFFAGTDMPGDKLVFIDESGAKTNMTRLYGWGEVGARVVGPVTHGHWRTCTMLAAVRLSRPLAAVTVDAAVDADAFVAWRVTCRPRASRPATWW